MLHYRFSLVIYFIVCVCQSQSPKVTENSDYFTMIFLEIQSPEYVFKIDKIEFGFFFHFLYYMTFHAHSISDSIFKTLFFKPENRQ